MKRILRNTFFPFVLLTALLLSGCLGDSNDSCDVTLDLSNIDQTQLQTELDSIDAYLERNNLEAEIESRSDIRYIITEEGDGTTPSACGFVEVTYEGRLLATGEVFDESDEAVTFQLLNLIPGWQLVLTNVKAGSKVTMFLPSSFAYGSRGNGGDIPPDATLIFDIHLLGAS